MRVKLLTSALLVALAGPTLADTPHKPHVSCKVLLPPQEIRNSNGHWVTVVEITVKGGHDEAPVKSTANVYKRVIKGAGAVSIDGQKDQDLAQGSFFAVPADTWHHVRNSSETDDMVMEAVLIGTKQNPEHVADYKGAPDPAEGKHCPGFNKAN